MCPAKRERELQAKPRTVSSKGPTGTPGLSSLPEEHWVVMVGCPVRQWLLLFQALADMVDFRAQDHSFSL